MEKNYKLGLYIVYLPVCYGAFTYLLETITACTRL